MELVMRTLIVTQMEFANQSVQFKGQKATEYIEAHALRVEYASKMVLVKFKVWNYNNCLDMCKA